jgi:branched-chain amino acid transport system substrate-binding protein
VYLIYIKELFMKKRIVLFILLILIIISLLCTCNSNQSIKIGYVGTLSGVNSDLGVSGRNGAKMAVDIINKMGGIDGKTLELIIKDDRNDKNIALQVDKELFEEGVVAIVGHMTSNMAELSVPYINENKILMLSPTMATDTLADLDDYFLRMIPSNVEQANAISAIVHEKGIKKASVVYDTANLTFAEGLKNQFESNYLKCCGTLVYEEGFSSQEHDFEAIANKILNSGAEGVYIIAASDNASVLSNTYINADQKLKYFYHLGQ